MIHQYVENYKNVCVRPLEEKDLEMLRIWRNDQKNSVFLRKIPYITPEAQKQWYQVCCARENEMVFAIDEIQKINGLVGSCALSSITKKEAEIGKILVGNPKAAGLHVGTNAFEAMKKLAAEKLGLTRLYAYTYEDNKATRRLLERTGFCYESAEEQNGRKELMYSIRLEHKEDLSCTLLRN